MTLVSDVCSSYGCGLAGSDAKHLRGKRDDSRRYHEPYCDYAFHTLSPPSLSGSGGRTFSRRRYQPVGLFVRLIREPVNPAIYAS